MNHHSNEEEQTIINPSREDVSLERREELGIAWLTRRNQLLEEGCASPDQVAALLEEAVDEGTLAPEGGTRGGRRRQGRGEGEGQGDRGVGQEGLRPVAPVASVRWCP